MKTLLMICTLLLSAPYVYAQNVGFFIPQKTLEQMNRPEKLPPLKIIRPTTATNATSQSTTPQPVKAPTIAQPMPQQTQAATPQPTTPQVQTAAPQPVTTQKAESQPQSADKTAPQITDTRPSTEEQPHQLQEMMVPQTGTPVEPIEAKDTAADNNKIAKVEAPKTRLLEPKEKEVFGFDDIIAEYRRDIQKISQNQPADNPRLQEVLKNYQDKTLIYN